MKTDTLSLLSRHYKLVQRPAALFVDELKVQVMERRETYADIVS